MWKCTKCQEDLDDTFGTCWKCGTTRGGEPTDHPEFFDPLRAEHLGAKRPVGSDAKKTKPLSYWRCLSMGLGFTAWGIFFVVPAYNWEGKPVASWLTFTLFPYAMIMSDFPSYNFPTYELHRLFRFLWDGSRIFFWLGQFPLYGWLLAWASRRAGLQLWSYTLLITHTLAVCLAGATFYRWVTWNDKTFLGIAGRIGVGMAIFITGWGLAKTVCWLVQKTKVKRQASAIQTDCEQSSHKD